MSDLKLVTIKNISPRVQQVFYHEQQVVLEPHEEMSFVPEVADFILEELGALVEKVEVGEIAGVYEPEELNRTTWVSNMTGNPDAPDTVKVPVYNKQTKGRDMVDMHNPLKDTVHIRRQMKGAEVQYTDRHGQPGSYIDPPTLFDLPAFQRREMSAKTAQWFLNRDRVVAPHEQGKSIQSREPSHFEPDMTWRLDDMRTYLRLCDPKAQLGPDEKEVRSEHRGPAGEIALHDAKRLAMKRLHFRLSDPQVKLPSKKAFEMQRTTAPAPRTKQTANA